MPRALRRRTSCLPLYWMFATSWGNSVSGEAEVVDGNFNTFSVELSDNNDAPAINYVVAAADSGEAGQYQWVAGFFSG